MSLFASEGLKMFGLILGSQAPGHPEKQPRLTGQKGIYLAAFIAMGWVVLTATAGPIKTEANVAVE